MLAQAQMHLSLHLQFIAPVFSLFVLLLLYISLKEKYMLKQAVSFFTFTFIAMVHITKWLYHVVLMCSLSHYSFHQKDFSLKIISRKFKTKLVVQY